MFLFLIYVNCYFYGCYLFSHFYFCDHIINIFLPSHFFFQVFPQAPPFFKVRGLFFVNVISHTLCFKRKEHMCFFF